MPVRKAEAKDKYEFLFLVKESLKENKAPFKLDLELMASNFDVFIAEDRFEIFVLEKPEGLVGILIGVVSNPIFSYDLQSTELLWFVTEEHRGSSGSIRLVKEFEKWSLSKGVKIISMADQHQLKDLSPMYSRLGYDLYEKTYIKGV